MTLPETRNEQRASATWGTLAEPLYLHELATPSIEGPLTRTGESAACIYFGRPVLLVRVSGGMLAAPPKQLVAELAKAGRKLEEQQGTPASQLRATVSWLEEEQREGLLHRSYSTASILIIVSSEEVWSWHVGPHGTFAGTIDRLSFRSTDLRMPVLYAHGFPKRGYQPPDAELRDKSSSAVVIGTPVGYECTRHEVGENTLIVEADRGTLPFGPLTDGSWSLEELCGKDAAWRHGLPGRALLVGRMQAVDRPSGWEVQTNPVDR